MYNKNEYRKYNDKKVLHKVKKQWVTVSIALLMMLGGGAVATHVTASANSNQVQPRISRNVNKPSKSKNITQQAKALHQHLLSKASVNKSVNHHARKQINGSNQGNLVTVNNKPAQKVNNINQLKMHQAKLYHGYVYNRINKPFQNVRVNHTIALHSSVDLDNSRVFGYLRPGRTVKTNRMFKQFGHYGNYIRYEINLANKRTAFITGNNNYVSYVIPARNYKYYQNKANKLVHKVNYKNASKIRKQLRKLTKQRNHNFRKYADLYESAFNSQQRAKYPVVVDYSNKKHVANKNTTITPVSNVTSVVSSAPSMPSYTYAPVVPSVAPISYSSATPSVSSEASSQASSSAKSISSASSVSSKASSASSNSAKSVSSSASSKASSKASSSAKSVSSKASSKASSSAKPASSSSSANSSSVFSSVFSSVNSSLGNSLSSVDSASSSVEPILSNDINELSSYAKETFNNANLIMDNLNPLNVSNNTEFTSMKNSDVNDTNADISSTTSNLTHVNDVSSATSINFNSLVNSLNGRVALGSQYASNTNDILNNKIPELKQLMNANVTRYGTYYGVNYKYTPSDDTVDFTNGTLNWTPSDGSFLSNNYTPAYIANAKTVKFDNVNVSNTSDFTGFLSADPNLVNLDLGNNFNTKNADILSYMISYDTHMKSLNLGSLDTSSIGNGFEARSRMDNMFSNDLSLTSLTLPTNFVGANNSWGYAKSDMENMFKSDNSLGTLTIMSPKLRLSNSAFGLSDKATLPWTNSNKQVLNENNNQVGTWTCDKNIQYANKKNQNSTNNLGLNYNQIKSDVMNHFNQALAPKNTKLSDNNLYNKLTSKLAQQMTSDWTSTITLNPSDIFTYANNAPVNSDMSPSDFDKRTVKSDERHLNLVTNSTFKEFSDPAGLTTMAMSASDFYPTYFKISDNSDRSPDSGYLIIHTIINCIHIPLNNNSNNNNVAQAIIQKLNPSNQNNNASMQSGMGFYKQGNSLNVITAYNPITDPVTFNNFVNKIIPQIKVDYNQYEKNQHKASPVQSDTPAQPTNTTPSTSTTTPTNNNSDNGSGSSKIYFNSDWDSVVCGSMMSAILDGDRTQVQIPWIVKIVSSGKPAPKSTPLNEQIPNIINPALAYILDNTPGLPPLNASDITLPARIHNGHLQFTGGDINAFIHSLGKAGLDTAKGKINDKFNIPDKIFDNALADVSNTNPDKIGQMKDIINKGIDQSNPNPTTTDTYSDKGPLNPNSVYNV